MKEPLLAEHERHSAVWMKLKAHYEKRLALLREQNDADLNDEQTAKKRGRIAEVKDFLALDKDPIQVPDEDLNFKD